MIHETAVVSPQANLGNGVEIGPYAIVEGDVTIGDGCRIGPRVTLLGHTTIGPATSVHTGAVIGDEPQDYHYEGGVSYTEVGSNCTIREYVTIHRGAQKGSRTVVGDHVMLMGLSHVAHNAVLGDHVVVANGVLIAGHVEIGPRAFLSGNAMVHQFARVGRLAMVGGGCKVIQDLPPFCLMQHELIQGLNSIGLKRAGVTPEARKEMKLAYRLMFRQGLNMSEALQRMREEAGDCREVQEFVQFIEGSQRGIISARTGKRSR